jgi:hypothetical protein
MNQACLFCQVEHPALSTSMACQICQKEIVENPDWEWGGKYRRRPPSYMFRRFGEYCVIIHFDYQSICIHYQDLNKSTGPILVLPLLPLTKDFIDNLPNKIANLLAFA